MAQVKLNYDDESGREPNNARVFKREGGGGGVRDWNTREVKKKKKKEKKRQRKIITGPHLIMINVEPKFKFIMFKNISLIRLYPQTYFVNYSFFLFNYSSSDPLY